MQKFSGPKGRADGFAAAVESMGWTCEEYDIVNGEDHDLTADHVWLEVRQKLRQGRYAALLAGSPCNTFTDAQRGDDEAPRPLKSATGPERYGLDELAPARKHKVQKANLMSIRTSESVEIMDDLQRPSIVEQPRFKDDTESVSM